MHSVTRLGMGLLLAGSFFGGCNCGGDTTMGGGDAGLDLLFTNGDGGGGGDGLFAPDLPFGPIDLAGADLASDDLSTDDSATPGADMTGMMTADLTGMMSQDLASTGDMANACPMPTQRCYTPMNKQTINVGVCKEGVSSCIAGMFGPCVGEVNPSMESCNGADDDCNGMADDGLGTVTCGVGVCRVTVAACTAGKPTICTPKNPGNAEICGNMINNQLTDDNCNGLIDEGCGCVYVAKSGADNLNCGNAGAPCLTIQYAISMRAGVNGLPKMVCVASLPNCGPNSPLNATYTEQVNMKDGVAVLGGYSPTVVNNAMVRSAGCTTTISDVNHNGVVFDRTIVAPTPLDGFTVLGHSDPTSTAITISGSTGAQVSNCIITGAGQMVTSGVEIVDSMGQKATPLLFRNAISSGAAPTAYGVHVLNSAPLIQGHCDTIDNQNRCISGGCFSNQPAPHFIRAGVQGVGPAMTAYAIYLQSSPGTVIEQNAICAQNSSGNEAGVRLTGDGTGVLVHTSRITTNDSPAQTAGFWADSCNNASPWLLNNSLVSGTSRLMGGRADGVRAVGACHVRVDSNAIIAGGQESANNNTNGVYCTFDPNNKASVSRCTVLNNTLVIGSQQGFPPNSAGVRCDDGACARIENNTRISGAGGVSSFGVILANTNTYVNGNSIDAGCAQMLGVGLQSNNSYARVQNNTITGSVAAINCAVGPTAPSFAVRVVNAPGPNEIDLHSNDIFGAGAIGGNCKSYGLAFDSGLGGQPPPPRGIVRNNIIFSGECMSRVNVIELNAAADPRLFENNDLWSLNGLPTALYTDENAMNLTMLAQVNALVGAPTASANLNANPMFQNGLHIPFNSPCTNTGTATGAPTVDYELDARPQQNLFDIGWDEYRP